MRRFALILFAFSLVSVARAEVVRVEIDSRFVVLEGREFGDVGAYERLSGKIFFALDPKNPFNRAIVDLDLATKNADGRVEAWANFMVLQPVDPKKRGTALLEVSNRGGKASLSYFNSARGASEPMAAEHFGDGLLMRRGLTVIWVGWQFDVPDRPGQLRLHVPRLAGVEGLVRSDWTVNRTTTRLDLGHRNHIAYSVVDPASEEHVLTRRSGRLSKREVVPRESWEFIVDGEGKLQQPARIFCPKGFQAGYIYELVYKGKDPAVVGLGLAAIRDTMSFARYDESCPFPVKRGIAIGISQTGRFLRYFLYRGFNIDEQQRPALDGFLIHTAGGGRGSFNHRFGQPSRDAHRYSAFFYPTDLFPFSGRKQKDPVSGREEGLLDRANAQSPAPKVFYTNSGYEYWGRVASLIHTTPDGQKDIEPLPNERIYHLASTQHFSVGFPPRDRDRIEGAEAYKGNPSDLLTTEKALLIALQDWVEKDVAPPASQYPTVADGSLVPVSKLSWNLPGLPAPTAAHEAYRVDYGPQWWNEGIITKQPPELGKAFQTLVPQLDAAGNERGGIPSVETLAPLASYLSWNLRQGMAGGNGELTDFYGTFVPLPLKKDESSKDTRPSIEELYESKDAYLKQVDAAIEQLTEQRFLLEEDHARVRTRAEQTWDWLHR